MDKLRSLSSGSGGIKDSLKEEFKGNLIELFKKRYGSSAEEVVDMAKETAEDISTGNIRRMYGYKKPMRDLRDVELYLDWLEKEGE